MHRRDFVKGVSLSTLAAALPAGYVSAQTQSSSLAPSLAPSVRPAARREVLSLNKGWRFFDGDIPFPKVSGHRDSYNHTKAGRAAGAAGFSYDDTDWPQVSIPHDFVSFQPSEKTENMSQGYRKRGVVWYRNTLRFDEADRGKHIELQLDGVATHATIWFNGTLIARNFGGYNAISLDLTPYITYGNSNNALAIRVDANALEGWWYEGGGIYRNVRIVKRSPVHVATDGVFAHPIQLRSSSGSGSATEKNDRWVVPIEVTLRSMRKTATDARVISELYDDNGQMIGRVETATALGRLSEGVVNMRLPVAAPKLWSIEVPTLYTVITRVYENETVSDEHRVNIGFRSQRFDAKTGFYLNDQPVKIKGVCLHQDHAGVGVAVPYGVLDFRLRRLKAMGCNAIRCAHNPQAPEFYDLCDRLGLLVMDENRMFNLAEDYREQLVWLIRAHRNHPSIIMWSVFNEEQSQGTEAGYEMVERMRQTVREYDSTRPVTAAMNGGLFAKINVSQAVDVVGFNYQHKDYDAFHAANPNLPLMSSEDTSAFMTRGAFTSDKDKHIATSYDDEFARWGASHREAWKMIDERPFVAGAFVWTGFDYHGEPTPYGWPSNSSVFGIMDLCGFDKAAFYIRQAQWITDRPVLWLTPHWNWPGKTGQPIKVMAISNLDEVELKLNGKRIGRQAGNKYDMNSFDVPYAAGKLEAIGYKAGKAVATCVVETTGPAYGVRLVPDRAGMAGDGVDAQPIRVEIVDSMGRVIPDANHGLRFTVEGGTIIGLGNGDPNSLEPEKGDTRSAFNGLAQVIVQSTEKAAVLKLTAVAEGLQSATLTLPLTAVALLAYQTTVQRVTFALTDWRASPLSPTPVDPAVKVADNDMNSWVRFRPGNLQPAVPTDGYALCTTTFTPYAKIRKAGGTLKIAGLTGAAEVFINARSVVRKDMAAPADIEVSLPPFEGEQTIAVRFRVKAADAYGLGGDARIEP